VFQSANPSAQLKAVRPYETNHSFHCIVFLVPGRPCPCSETDLLQRALTCKLQDNELSSLLQDLAKTRTDFKKPTFLYALTSVDVYQLDSAISANGYTSSQVVVAPARVLMVVPGKALKEVIATLRLEESSFSPARRVVRPTVSIIAF
jgi:hypothetical protein